MEPERPRKRIADLTPDDIPLSRVSTAGPPSYAAWDEIVAFVRTLGLPDANTPEDEPHREAGILLRGVLGGGTPTLNDAVLADVPIDGLYTLVSRGRPRPWPAA